MPAWLGGSFLQPYGIEPQNRWHFAECMFLRWYDRVRSIAARAETPDYELSGEDWDFIFAYFASCWHLRHWLLASRPDLGQGLDGLTKGHVEIQIARDICNGTKHGELTRRPGDADFNIYREYDHFAGEACENAVKYRVAGGEGQHLRKFDLFELADACMNTWRSFLEGCRLISRP